MNVQHNWYLEDPIMSSLVSKVNTPSYLYLHSHLPTASTYLPIPVILMDLNLYHNDPIMSFLDSKVIINIRYSHIYLSNPDESP